MPETSPGPFPGPPPGPRSRPLLLALVALYLASLGAAAVVFLRKASSRGPGSSLLKIKRDRIGWIRIDGPIYAGEAGAFVPTGVRAWSKRLRALAEKDEVKSLVLEINSPGGSVGAVQELHSQLLRIRQEKGKPVVALLGDVAASGGYYLAAACDKVVAHPGTLTGSIGVIFQVGNVEGLLGKVGVKVEPIKSGRLKDIGSSVRPMTAEERALLQGLIDDAYSQFFEAVRTGRRLDPEKLKLLADGRIFTGRQAKENGLVDELGDSHVALKLAGSLGGIVGEPKVDRSEEPWEDLMGLLESRAVGLGALASLARLEGPRLEYLWTGF